MEKRLNELIKDYEKKREMIEADQKRIQNDLLMQTKVRIGEEFSNKELMDFEVYDQFFNQIYEDLLTEQKKFNEYSNQLLTIKRNEFISELGKILEDEDEKVSDSNLIVTKVMDSAISSLENVIFEDGISEEKVSEQVSTDELEELLAEIHENFNE